MRAVGEAGSVSRETTLATSTIDPSVVADHAVEYDQGHVFRATNWADVHVDESAGHVEVTGGLHTGGTGCGVARVQDVWYSDGTDTLNVVVTDAWNGADVCAGAETELQYDLSVDLETVPEAVSVYTPGYGWSTEWKAAEGQQKPAVVRPTESEATAGDVTTATVRLTESLVGESDEVDGLAVALRVADPSVATVDDAAAEVGSDASTRHRPTSRRATSGRKTPVRRTSRSHSGRTPRASSTPRRA